MLQKGRLFSQTGDSDPKTGDSEVEFAGGTAANVNVITITSTITSNVNLAASFCCKALEEEPAKLPIYQKLFRQVGYDQEAIVAALLYTLVHRRDGTIRNPAAVFTQRCKDYHHSGVPEEAAALVEQYGLLPWVQLLEVLSGPISPKTPASVPATAGRTTFVHQTPALLPPLRPGIRIPARITLKKGGGMTGEEAKRLWSLVAHDRRVALCNKEIIPLSDGTYVLLLDNTVSSTVRQAAFYSEQEWYLRTATLTDCFALFAADCEPLARARRAPRSGGGQA
jgi:hypothetical protein